MKKVLLFAGLLSLATTGICQSNSIVFLKSDDPTWLFGPKYVTSLSNEEYVTSVLEYANSHKFIDQLDTIHILEYDQLKKVTSKSTLEGYLPIESSSVFFREKDGELVGVVTNPGLGDLLGAAPYTISEGTREFVYKDNELIYYCHDYTNSSRMGSCGTIHMQLRGYFQADSLYTQESLQGNWNCYWDNINGEAALDQAEFWLETYETWKRKQSATDRP
ncbi:MAG: hypothetical protein MK081_05315 [Flavobacteriales bacterium]|nr:hypothetical protein [Flavobacteriales bacterium]